jgi:hypothetical protein
MYEGHYAERIYSTDSEIHFRNFVYTKGGRKSISHLLIYIIIHVILG